jgi:hypothetical protein
MAKNTDPIELRPRAQQDGRVDIASVRWTLEHMHNELAANSELGRVRNALAIALLEIDRVQQSRTGPGVHGAAWSRYLTWPKRS